MEWINILKRETDVLTIWQAFSGYRLYKEMIGIDFRPKQMKYYAGDLLLNKPDLMNEFIILSKESEKDPALFKRIFDKIENDSEILLQKIKELDVNLKEKSNSGLKETFLEYNQLITNYHVYTWIIHTINRILIDKVKSELPKEKAEEYLTILTAAQYKDISSIEELKQLLIVANNNDLKRIYKNYNWLGAVKVGWGYLTQPYTLDHYKELIGEYKKPIEKLNEIYKNNQKLLQEYEMLVYSQGFDKKLIDLVRRGIYIKTYRGEIIVRAMLGIKPLLYEIAARFDLKIEDVVHMLPNEIVDMLQTGKTISVDDRKKGYSLVFENDDIKLETKIIAHKKIINNGEIFGNGIVKGYARGKVKIIKNKKDLDQFEEGDILVTLMTSPDMVPAILKAKAIVTDEGGLTCHAAIISRELNIPAVIGTKNATKVLKDGMVIEVNSDKGEVKIIS